ncbi:MAG TPA: glycoside hydrolase domain-containing protein, partial [Puia sp.]|nr:glycoside hydrolase domain-containing protein [Puia sp.]
MISLASWAQRDTTITLDIDWQRLGIDKAHATIEAPAITNFQPPKKFTPGDPIPVEKGKGWLLLIR